MSTRKKPGRQRRQFTDEFKAGAVRLVVDEGRISTARRHPGGGSARRRCGRKLEAVASAPGGAVGAVSGAGGVGAVRGSRTGPPKPHVTSCGT